MEPSLDRITALVDLLGDPQRGYPIVHLTGTNGKTSTARMVDALLSEIGLRTGRYTSPHLQSATERITIDGRPITAERYVEVYRDVAPYVELVDAAAAGGRCPSSRSSPRWPSRRSPTRRSRPAIVEVGLGGRWDATNVADGKVAVVTPIGLDHAEYLGDDVLGSPGRRPGSSSPVRWRCSPRRTGPWPRCCSSAASRWTPRSPGRASEFGVPSGRSQSAGSGSRCRGSAASYEDIFLPLHGEHQATNAALALAAVEALVGAGPRSRSTRRVRAAFAAVALAGPAGAGGRRRRRADRAGRRRAQPARGHALWPRRWPRSSVLPAGRRVRGDGGQGRPRHPGGAGAGAARGGRHPQLLAAGHGPRRAGRAGHRGVRSGAGAASSRGWPRPSSRPASWPRRAGESGVGVVVTGSVVTAGEAGRCSAWSRRDRARASDRRRPTR